ncbi:MAG: hypothetical protein HQ478_11020 [Chloroflexi bacterium]|nr:hypothetical protein [Chloroflexota bacterium]
MEISQDPDFNGSDTYDGDSDGRKGKPPRREVEDLLIRTLRRNPELSNHEICEAVRRKFPEPEDQVSDTTVGRRRHTLDIPNSRVARNSSPIPLLNRDRKRLERLIGYMIQPDALRWPYDPFPPATGVFEEPSRRGLFRWKQDQGYITWVWHDEKDQRWLERSILRVADENRECDLEARYSELQTDAIQSADHIQRYESAVESEYKVASLVELDAAFRGVGGFFGARDREGLEILDLDRDLAARLPVLTALMRFAAGI